MNPQPTLTTERLILRPFTLDDASEVQRLCGDFAIADTTQNVPHPYPEGEAEKFIAAHPAKFEQGEGVVFAVTLKETGALVGGMGLTLEKKFRRAEIGYWIAKDHWNQGYGTEAARATIDFGFKQWSLHKIVGTYLKRNPASGRVIEKIGMVQEGILRDHVIKWDRFEDLVTCASFEPTPTQA